MDKARSIVLMSGGIDSSAVVATARSEGSDMSGLFVDYGQPAAGSEWHAVQQVARHFGIEAKKVELGFPWVVDGSDFPKQGMKSAGVARQYCGRLGKVANCQAGMFLAQVSPLGRALVDKRLYLPESWTGDDARCQAAGVPQERREYRSKTELALEMVERALTRGHLKVRWVAGDDAFGVSPSFREGLSALGMRYVLDVPASFTVWPEALEWTSPAYQGRGRPTKPRLQRGQRRTMPERAFPPQFRWTARLSWAGRWTTTWTTRATRRYSAGG